MKCPVCSNENLIMTERRGVEIDYCKNCRGVWLDRGELDKIIERSSSGPAQNYAREQQRPSSTHGYHKKKKSILSEIFDF